MGAGPGAEVDAQSGISAVDLESAADGQGA